MLTHNAPKFVWISITSLRKNTDYENYELVVVDNASKIPTRVIVWLLKKLGHIDSVAMVSYNSLFAKGNNIAAAIAASDSDKFLLLNSDVKINHRDWLTNLLDMHTEGISSYGIVEEPLRVDGYCYLIDAELYKKHPLDEQHEWWWSITKQQALLLNEGYNVVGLREHEHYLHHYGGKSGSDFKRAKGMKVSPEDVEQWFNGKRIVAK
jgi:hypothetical protein